MSQITITDEMKKALDLIENTNDHVFITGKAGTGKTTFLRYLVSHAAKKLIVTASTGIAAINAGGMTLHSLLKIPLGPISPEEPIKSKLHKDRYNLLNRIDGIIIDEISMVRPDVMDFVDKRLQLVKQSDKPFGGLQIIMFGDLFQLPPVIARNEADVLDRFYKGPYFFHANVFNNTGFHVIELNHIFRQSDRRFIEILNNIRAYQVTDDDLEDLGALRDKVMSQQFTNHAIHICTHRVDVDDINNSLLGEPTHTFEATIKDDFSLNHFPCDQTLKLRVGARVMTLVNNRTYNYFNGSLGTVEAITPEKIVVQLDSGIIVPVEKFTWEACDYTVEKGEIKKQIKGTCSQFPLSLAWAITIHKSQGLTFDNVVIHTKGVFCPGQIYVALSRCRTMEGIISDSFISKKHILADRMLMLFENQYKQSGNYYGKRIEASELK